MNDIRLYKCYSENQKDWLYNKGIRYILKARDYNNSNKMWLYHENDLLNDKLQEWHDNNPNYKK